MDKNNNGWISSVMRRTNTALRSTALEDQHKADTAKAEKHITQLKNKKLHRELDAIEKECESNGKENAGLDFGELKQIHRIFIASSKDAVTEGKIPFAALEKLLKGTELETYFKDHKGDLSLRDISVLYFNKLKKQDAKVLETRLKELEEKANVGNAHGEEADEVYVDGILRKLFKRLDEDGNGTLDQEELKKGFEGSHLPVDVEKFLLLLDGDHNGTVDEEEWMGAWKKALSAASGKITQEKLMQWEDAVEVAVYKKEHPAEESGPSDDVIVFGGLLLVAAIAVGAGVYLARRK
jgi:Ca2+-binding EF-hand superfamily protein